jgi:hypothetical protein
MEEFLVRDRLGQEGTAELSARQVDAFLILETELRGEREDAQQKVSDDISKYGPDKAKRRR